MKTPNTLLANTGTTIFTVMSALATEHGAINLGQGFPDTEGPADVVRHLEQCGVVIEEGPAPKYGALGPITSVYCRDPDGNLVEISSYL